MKLSDFVIHYLADLGIKHVFVVTGGYAVNLIDSIHQEPRIQHIPVNHEQVAAMAAEAYARFSGISAVITTNAPGALNLLNGIDGAWNDAIPCIFICGQVTRARWNRAEEKPLGREIVDIVTIVESITKYAAYVDDPTKIKYHLDKATHIAREGRPGPVLLDIPLDVQKAQIEVAELKGHTEDVCPTSCRSCQHVDEMTSTKIQAAWNLIKEAKRPVVLLGGGIRQSGTMAQAKELIEKLGVPAVVTWSAFDVLGHDHPLYFGNIGSYGNRRANYTIQNSDLILLLGARLNVRQTGGEPSTFAREAKKIMVDLDSHEIERATVKIDLPINCSLQKYFETFLNLPIEKPEIGPWLRRVQSYRVNFPDVLPEYYEQKNSVNVYAFMEKLSQLVPPDVPVVTDCGGNLIWTMQAFRVKEGQRVFSNMGLSSMGYSLAASIGVCLANGCKPVVCIIGDGGFQVHIQELQTIRYHNLPIKIFVVNNKSYGIIKQTIESWFNVSTPEELEKRCLAVSNKDGYSCPDFIKVGRAYGLETIRIKDHAELEKSIEWTLAQREATICDVNLDEHQKITPRLEFGRPLEDQHPLIDRATLKEIMVIGSPTENQEGEQEGI